MVTVAVVGAGYWGKNIVRTIAAQSAARLKYIVDSSETVRASYNQLAGTIVTDDYGTVLDDREVDAVMIATPPVTHHALASAALDAGKHVFIEKPMTLEVSHAEDLVARAESLDLRLMVGHLLLYHPCVTAMKNHIDNGDIGDVYYFYCQRLNLGKVRSDENALQSFAPHDISVALYLVGETPDSVSASGSAYLQKNIEDVAFVNLHFPGGQIAHVHVSWLDPHKVRRATVVGSKKMMVFDDMEPREKIRIYDKGVDISGEYGSYGEFLSLRDGNIHIPVIKMSEPLCLECEHFISSVATGARPLSDGYNGLLVTRVLDAAQSSLKSGGIPVRIVG